MRLLAAEPRSTAGLLVHSQSLSGTIFLIMYLILWDRRVLRTEPMLFQLSKLHVPFSFSTVVHFSSFFLKVYIVGLGSSDLALPALNCRPCLAIKIIITILIIIVIHHFAIAFE